MSCSRWRSRPPSPLYAAISFATTVSAYNDATPFAGVKWQPGGRICAVHRVAMITARGGSSASSAPLRWCSPAAPAVTTNEPGQLCRDDEERDRIAGLFR